MDFGIDFGTTNSACVGIQEGRRVVKYSDGYGNPFPSLIIIDKLTGNVFCGREAWRKREELREFCEVIPSVKTYLGTDKTWIINGKAWTPEMVAAQVFLGLKSQVTKKGSIDELKEAVVSIPVGFSPEKRRALRIAADMAGVEIKNFVSEPTAAFFRHLDEIGSKTKVAVFDWGGGTLDVSIIENRHGRVKELATSGVKLGGDDIDRKLAEWAHSVISREKNIPLTFDQMPPSARDKLIANCEQAKRDLSNDDLVEIRIWKYGEFGEVAVNLDIDTFTNLILHELEQAILCFEKCLATARISLEELDCILMVGGSVNLRPFGDIVHERWKGKEFFPMESDWSVAQGAAGLSLNPGSYLLAQSFGLTLSDETFFPLLEEGEFIDINEKVACTLALIEDSDTANIIFSDEKGLTLGAINVPSFGFFKEKIDLNACIDNNLILNVTASSRTNSHNSVWSYNNLRIDYQLPVVLAVGDE